MSVKLTHRFSSRFYIIAILSSLFILDGFALWLAAKLDYDSTLERARIILSRSAASFEERMKRTVVATEAILNNRAERIQEHGIEATISSVKEWERFRTAAQGLPDVGSLWLLDNKANLLMDSTEYPSQRVNFSEREYFAPQKARGIEFYIGPVVKGRITKKYSFTISRRMSGKDGSFLGIVLAAIETDDFSNYLRQMDIGENSTVIVFGTDGALILRQPMLDEFLGKTFKHLKLFSISFDKEPSGIYETSAMDGIKRLIAYKKIEGLPLVVATSIPIDSLLKEWGGRLKMYSLIAAIAFFALVGLSWLVRRTTLREDKGKMRELSEINQSLQMEISERKRVEEALEAAYAQAENEKNRLRALMEALPVGVALVDEHGGSTLINQEYQRIWGHSLAPVNSVDDYVAYKAWWVDTGEPVQAEEWGSALAVKKGESTIGQLMEINKFDGSRAFIHNSAAPIRDAGGQIVGCAVVIMDITDQEVVRKALKKIIERLDIVSSTASQLLFSSEPQRIVETLCRRVMEHLDCQVFFNFLVDDERNCLRLNAYAGIPEETAREMHFLDYGVAVCGCAARDACRIVAENIPTTPDIRTDLVRSFGVKAYACHPFFAQGQVVGTLSFGTKSRSTFTEDELFLMKTVADQVATAMERKRLLESETERADELEMRVQERTAELEQAYENLEREVAERAQVEAQLRHSQKMEAIGTLAGGIAHDFNNILAAIIGFSEMVEEDLPPGDPSTPHVQRVLNAASRGRELVQQILAFSRKTEHARHPVSISFVAKETVQFLRASIPTTIEIILDNTATSDTILATPVEVQQVLLNLATNAALSMQDKGGTLHISITDTVVELDALILDSDIVPGEYVQLVVRDTGTGIAPDLMKRIFEPFFTTREVGQGTGMGLAVVYGIVKSLHGSITVESEPGVGSTFQILLPKVTYDKRTEASLLEQSLTGQERILFIDDEEFLVEWGQTLLERMGYEVTTMNDSTKALEAFSSDPSRFDLVITDQTMPGITGLNLARELLKIRPDIPVILCTGHSESVTLDKLKEAGVREFLMKPLAKKDLTEVIRRVLDKEMEA